MDIYSSAAWMLDCETAAIHAIATVEAGPYGGFLPSGEPVILYERHLFHRYTRGRYDTSYPDLSSSIPGGYGLVRNQHSKLQRAASLDRDAALRACSWGKFQILGNNWQRCGATSLQDFINRMYRSEEDHFRAFVWFIATDVNLHDALRDRDWPRVAYLYNGPAYSRNKYDIRMKQAYDQAV